ncbi:MAG: Calx-beta domain-containing protein [Acidobacteriota bacterium]
MKIMRWLLITGSTVLLCLILIGQLMPNTPLVRKTAAQSSSTARIFFVDIGQGAGTLIVSPTGKTLLVDAGPNGNGTNKVIPLLNNLGIASVDFTIVTHYHIDHIAGITEVLNANRVAGMAFDNGDGADVVPPNPGGTRTAYLNYVSATQRPGVTRQTIQNGQVIDLGGGMRATCLVAGGRLGSGGVLPVSTLDINSQSISVLVEYNNFDYLVSGDLTGAGSTTTARGPDLESFVGQQAGDVDVIQLNHHGSTTSSNQRLLSYAKAEVAVAQIGETNTFGHPNREVVNRYLNTPTTNGNTFNGTGVPTAGVGPVFYQTQASPVNDPRVTQQGYSGAAFGNGGSGTLLLETDGVTNYTMKSFDDGGARISPTIHNYPVDSASSGVTTDLNPTVVPSISPAVPLASDSVVVSAMVNDRESPISSVMLNYSLNGTPQTPLAMTLTGGLYQATIPPQPNGTRVEYTVTGTAGGQSTSYNDGYFSGTTPVSALQALNANGEPLYIGFAARIVTTVTASTGTYSTQGNNEDYVQDATGGINIFRTVQPPGTQAILLGQTVEVRGLIGMNTGRTRLEVTPPFNSPTSPYGITIITSGTPPTPTIRTIAQLNANPEGFEGQLISIANCTVVSGSIPPAPASDDGFLTITDGSGNFSLKIDRDTNIPGLATPSGTFTVTGIIQQDDIFRPFTDNYNIAPRSRTDLGAADPGSTLISIADARIDAVDNGDGTPPPDFIPDLLTQTVKVRGVVTSIDFRGGNGIEYYIQDTTGGVDIFNTTANFGPFAIGDNVEVIGSVKQFNGLTEIDPGTTLTNITLLPPNTLPPVTPQLITLSQVADGGVGEAVEGRLVRIDNITIVSGTFPPTGNSGNVTISDGTGTAILRVDSDTNIDGTPTPTGTFSLIGLASQFDTSSPFDSGYQILPRATTDIILATSTFTATPTTVDFGTVTLGSSSNSPVTITNTGTGTVTLTPPFIITGTNANQFSVGTPGTTTLAPGDSTTVTTTFSPTGSGLKTATLTITSSNAGSVAVTLTGTGQAAATFTATPTTVDFGTVNVGTSTGATVTLMNTGSVAVTFTPPFTITGTDANQFSVGAPGTTTLAPGDSTTVTTTFSPTTGGLKTATLTITSSNAGSVNVTLTGMGQAGGGTPVVISEFRVRGPNGGNDEFVEIYNNTDSPIDISGWKMKGSNNAGTTSTRATVNANTMLPARGHFLFVNTTAPGYSGAVPGNKTYTTGITDDGGIAITMPNDTIVDQVGLSNGSAFKEGTPLASLGTQNLNRGYERKPGGLSGSTMDTNNNSTDFQLITPSDPQNLASPPTPAPATPSIQFSAATYSVNETGGSATITVVRTGSTSSTVTVDYATSDGTATAGADYTATTGTLSFGSGETTKTFNVPVLADLLAEPNETVNLALSNPTGGATLGTPSTAVLTIVNVAAAGTLQFSAATYSVMENGGSATITVNRINGSDGIVSVNYATSNGTATAGADYTATSGTLTFLNGETTKTFSVPVLADFIAEPDETVNLSLSNPTGGATLGTPSTAVLTIVNVAAAGTLQFSAATYSVMENGGSATITVTRTNGSEGTVTVDYATSDGTATAGADYTATTGTLSFGSGETTKTFSVPVLADLLAEPNETVNLALSNPTGGATLGTPSTAVLTIVNVAAAGTLQFSAATYSVTEDGISAGITVTRTNGSEGTVTVNYTTSNGTATAGADYTATSGTLTLLNGETLKSFSIPITDDANDENDETVNLMLSSPTGGATLGTPASAVLTITDNDNPAGLVISDVAQVELNSGASAMVFTVTLVPASGLTVTVDYTTINGTATSGSDYVAASGRLTFTPGTVTQPITVMVNSDIFTEINETFFVNLSNAVNATLGDSQGVGTIINDDLLDHFTIYAADANNNRIQRSTDDGNTWSLIGAGPGTGPGQFNGPRGVTSNLADTIIFVADTRNNRIQRSTDGGNSWQVIAGAGTAIGSVNGPQGVAYDEARDILYIADTLNSRIQAVSTASATPSFASFASSGTGIGQVLQPRGIAVDNAGNVYVADTLNNRIQVNTGGTWTIFAGATAGTQVGKVNGPRGIYVDTFGHVLVADTANNRIQMHDGKTWSVFMIAGTVIGTVKLPEGVTVTATANVIVSDTGNNRVQRKPLVGTTVTIVGSPGSGLNQFNQPAGVR